MKKKKDFLKNQKYQLFYEENKKVIKYSTPHLKSHLGYFSKFLMDYQNKICCRGKVIVEGHLIATNLILVFFSILIWYLWSSC